VENTGLRISTHGWRTGPQQTHPGAGDARQASRTLLLVTSESLSASGSVPYDYGVDPAAYRWMRPLAIGAIAVVVTAVLNSHPAPGLRGDHAVITVALIAFAIGTITVVRLPDASSRVLLPIMAVVVVAAGTLVGFQPDGAGFLGVFPAVSAAALRLPVRAAALVASLAVAALTVGWTIGGGHRPVIGIVLNQFGVAAFFLLALFARRYREANDHARQLIAELNESRAAQAQAAALGERQRLAREMHDVLAHSLSGLVLNLEGARLLAEQADADPRLADTIGRAQRLAGTGLEEARRAIGMLRGDALPGPEGLAKLADEFEADTGIACSFVAEGDGHELGADGRLTLYRVAQEALTNIRKHARPDRVEIRLSYDGSGAELTVEDHASNGNRPPPGDGTGYGLTGMRERAELLGGRLAAAPTNDGFRVVLWIPS
jgi:signal transduction histidine kinase